MTIWILADKVSMSTIKGNKMKKNKLKEYLRKNEISQVDFAKKLKLSKSTFHRYMTGTRKMPLEVAVKIEKLTKGKVTCKSLS